MLDGKTETSITETIEFEKRLSKLPQVYKAMIGEIASTDYVRELAVAIANDSAIAVGDASV